MRFHHSLAACALAGAMAAANPAAAQGSAANYPNRPVSVVIPFVAGGSADNEARMYTEKLQASLGQPFVFDYRGGAASSIGVDYVLKAAPDGYTIMMHNTGLTVFPNFYPALNHSVVSTLVPITELSNRAGAVIISTAALPKVNSLPDLAAYGKANPGKLHCNTAGSGGITHIVCAALANALGAPITPVHYKGVAQGQIDLIAGRTQVSGGTVFNAMSQVKAGKLRFIAILGPERTKLMPEVRTSHEQGYDVDYPAWFGAFAPPRTPQAIVAKLNTEMVKAVRAPDVVAALEKMGNVPIASTPEAFRKSFQAELAYWKKIVEVNRIKSTE